jgi:hypothetical protein
MTRRDSTPPEGRDQDPTTFAEILQVLLRHEPRAIAAVLIDSEGETVDYASSLSSYYTKVAAANLRVVLDDLADAWGKMPPGDALHQATIRAHQRSFFVRPLADGYALVLVLKRRAFAVSARAVTLATSRLAKEAGWPAPPEETLPWHPAEVETTRADRFRPKQMKAGDAWEQVEVLGVVGRASAARHATERGEKGYRCRLQGGAEITLVREPTGVWFVDQPTRGLSSRLGPESVRPALPPTKAPSNPIPNDSSGSSETASPIDVGTAGQTGDMWAKEAKRAR